MVVNGNGGNTAKAICILYSDTHYTQCASNGRSAERGIEIHQRQQPDEREETREKKLVKHRGRGRGICNIHIILMNLLPFISRKWWADEAAPNSQVSVSPMPNVCTLCMNNTVGEHLYTLHEPNVHTDTGRGRARVHIPCNIALSRFC